MRNATIIVMLGLSLAATTAGARSQSHPYIRSEAAARKQCKLQCREAYSGNVSVCGLEPRGQKGDCRKDARAQRSSCLATCD
jgi:hypothetical protein